MDDVCLGELLLHAVIFTRFVAEQLGIFFLDPPAKSYSFVAAERRGEG